MSDNKVTLDQLDNSAVEAMSSSVGDVSMLNTENKTIVGALAEIVGKKEIANAIGEPLAETDKFTEMSSEINGLLSTFKTNMMNAGVVVESGDKFKALIDKIQGLTEGEGNKGIQINSGSINPSDLLVKTLSYNQPSSTTSGSSGSADWYYYDLNNLDHEPTIFIVYAKYNIGSQEYNVFAVYDSILLKKFINQITAYLSSYGTTSVYARDFTNIDKNIIPVAPHSDTIVVSQIDYLSIEVGEEDTTLRDSLASILEEKGVEVTEEDDMASLIGKVDNNLINIPKSYTLYESGVTSDDLGGWTKVHEDLTPSTSDTRYGSATITVADDGLIVTVRNGSAGGLRSGHKSNNYFSLVNYTKIKADITLISDMVNSDARDWFGIKLYDSADNAIAENSFSGTATALTTFTLEIDVTNINVAKVSILGRAVGTAETVDIKCTKIWLE